MLGRCDWANRFSEVERMMAVWLTPPWYAEDGTANGFADVVHQQDRPTHSQFLGPDGEPIPYRTQPLGFDLTSRKLREKP
jgi:hypothetical protein